jgi:DNA-binding SARP family transcriptional activator
MREQLSIRLLGRMELRAGTTPVRLTGRQPQALLALLVLDRRRRTREAVATDLWPESSSTSTGCLRQALWLVRNAFAEAGVDPDAYLEVDGDALAMRLEAPIVLDVDAFEAAARGRPVRASTAVALYCGDLVEALGQECFAAERERLSDLYEDMLQMHAEACLAGGDFAGAREHAERLLARDPLREEAHVVLIETHARTGTRSQVVRQYRRLRAVLDRELAVEPLPETELAYREALATTIARSRRAASLRPIPLLPGGTGRGPSIRPPDRVRPAMRSPLQAVAGG